MWQQMMTYFHNSADSYWGAVWDHLTISVLALMIAVLVGVPAGFLCVKYKRSQKFIVAFFGVLRIIPSLAILLLLLPIMGTGTKPALVALVLLAVPPILMNTVAGLEDVPDFMLETAFGCGMTESQVWRKVRFPLAMSLILTGIKTAAIEVIASATLAAKIGAGGLGEIIFTGLGLNRFDLLLIGGLSVAVLSVSIGLLFELVDRLVLKHKLHGRALPMKRKKLTALFLALVAIGSLAACSKGGGTEATIRVGSKDFTENLVVAEIYALALEDAGYKVERKLNIAGSVVHASITGNEIDLYPEYTGTGLLSILQMDMMTDPDAVYQTVKEEYNKQFGITWLDQSRANDGQGLVIRTELANRLNIKTISDLQRNADKIRFASQGEFDQREDGIPGLEKVYGTFNFQSSKLYDNGLKYQILENNEADVAPAYTTEGQLVNTDLFTLLEDDKNFWPPYYLAPIIRNEVLEANPGIAEILNKIGLALDTETVTALNATVDVDKVEYEEAAKAFYDSIK